MKNLTYVKVSFVNHPDKFSAPWVGGNEEGTMIHETNRGFCLFVKKTF